MGDEKQIALSETEKLARLRLIRSAGVGPATFNQFINRYGSAVEAVEHLPAQKLIREDQLHQEIEAINRFGARLIYLGSDDYPTRLAAIPDAPPILTVKGTWSLLHATNIGVVGARNASAGGLKLTKQICAALSEKGIVITSGLARGIDGAAHSASLAGGTIACLAGGIDFIYPMENKEIYEGISKTGVLVSEMPFGTKPQARHFPRRNRIISGLSDGLLVIEAARKSGSLITARYAADHGRDVYAIPGSPLDPRAQGANQLIKDGAILTQSAGDILNELESMPLLKAMPIQTTVAPSQTKPVKTPQKTQTRTIENNDVMSLLSLDPIHIDEIVRLSGKPTEAILSEFMTLELSGKIMRHTGNRFSRFSPKNE